MAFPGGACRIINNHSLLASPLNIHYLAIYVLVLTELKAPVHPIFLERGICDDVSL